MWWRRLAAVAGLLALVAGCGRAPVAIYGAPVDPVECPPDSRASHAVFLIGDAGDPKLPPDGSDELVDPVLRGLHARIAEEVASHGEDGVFAIFLGDNVYKYGMAPPGHRDRRRTERVLEAQIAAAAPAQTTFVLGNHDWQMNGPEGWTRALAQREFLRGYAPRVRTRPEAGCTGPETLDVGEQLRFVFADEAAYEHVYKEPEEHARFCPHRSNIEAYLDLAAEFDDPGRRHVAFVMHHPLVTAGPHGGHFTWKQHIFPLTDFWSWAWLPLPIIGSAYPLARQFGVSQTDLTNEEYDRMIREVFRAARPRVPDLYVAGHEHSLQLHRDELGIYYLVSGAGSTSKIERVEPMPTAMMTAARAGFMRLDVHDTGALRLSVFALDGAGGTEKIFRHCLADRPPEPRRRRAEP